MVREFRFGIGLRAIKSAERFREKVRRFADLGYDVVHIPDHIGAPAPFATMMAAADAADIRVGTFVLNAAFYSPALLARDAVAVDILSEGRLELGLGTGYVREEFEAAEIPYPSAGQRVDHLRHTTTYIKAVAPTIPVLIAGNGHLRRDIGVPHYLRVLAARNAEPAATAPRVMSVAFMERSEDGTPDEAHGTQDEAWFTPRAERTDPCASFKPPGPLPPARLPSTAPSAAPAPRAP